MLTKKIHFWCLSIFLMFSCQPSSKEINIEDPCKDKAKASSDCLKTTGPGATPSRTTTGPRRDDFGRSESPGGRTSSPDQDISPTTSPGGLNGGGISPSNNGGGLSNNGGGLSNNGGGFPSNNNGGGLSNNGGGLNGGENNRPPSTNGGNQGGGGNNRPPSGQDYTSQTKLGVMISELGELSLQFNGDNQNKFTDMKFETERTQFPAKSGTLGEAGFPTEIGPVSVKGKLSFQFDGKSCTGNFSATLLTFSNVTVSCN